MLWATMSYSTLGKGQAAHQSTLICRFPYLQTRLTIQITPKLGKDTLRCQFYLIFSVCTALLRHGEMELVLMPLFHGHRTLKTGLITGYFSLICLYAPSSENLVKRTTEHIGKVHAIPFIPARTIPGDTTAQRLPLETCSGQPHPAASAPPFQADKRVRADEEPGWIRRHTQECPSWSRQSFIWLCFDLLYRLGCFKCPIFTKQPVFLFLICTIQLKANTCQVILTFNIYLI